MIDIHKEALKHYELFLTHKLRDDSKALFPLEIRVSRPQKAEDRSSIKLKTEYLQKNSKAIIGHGYTIEWEKSGNRTWSEWNNPKRVYFENEIEYLKFISKEKEIVSFLENVALIKQTLPELIDWIAENPKNVLDYQETWPDLLKVCTYFKNDHVPNKFYVRELPVLIETKFIENNKSIIMSLLDFLIPNKITPSKNFFIRYSIRDKEKLIRIRILCNKLAEKYNYTDFSIRLSDFINTEIASKNVFITENELNFLTLPQKENSIAIWSGGGFQISYIANIDWLKRRQIYYWGDVDAAGLAILSQLRTYYPHPNSVSLLMDRTTFDKYYHGGKSDKKIPANTLKGLSEKEIELFHYLKKDNLRLEQEKIPQSEISALMNLII